jgi:hypothetical protein
LSVGESSETLPVQQRHPPAACVHIREDAMRRP